MTDTPAQRTFRTQDRVVVATPCYGGNVKLDYMNSLFRACTELAIPVEGPNGAPVLAPLVAGRLHIDKESHIDRARNKLANRFLRDTPFDWLMFIDADVVFEPAHLMELWQHGMRGHRVVAAPYAMKRVATQFAVNALPGAKADAQGLVEVSYAGTGFLLLHRGALEALVAGGFAAEYQVGANDRDHAHHGTHRAFFKSGVRDVEGADGASAPIWLSEDYMLCHELRQCGLRIMMDSRLQLGHIGDLTYPVPAQEIVSAFRLLRQIRHPALPGEAI